MKLKATLQLLDPHDSCLGEDGGQLVYRYRLEGAPLPLGLTVFVREQNYMPSRRHFILTNLTPCCDACWVLEENSWPSAWRCQRCHARIEDPPAPVRVYQQVLITTARLAPEGEVDWSSPLFLQEELSPVDARLLEWFTFAGLYPAEEAARAMAVAVEELAKELLPTLPPARGVFA